MATSQKISELTTAGPLTGAELVPVVQNSGTLQTTVSAIKVFSLGNVENEVALLNSRVDAVSVLATQDAEDILNIQGDLGDLTIRVAAVSASVSSLNVRMSAAEASISAINSALAAIDVSALSALEPRVSALEIRVGLVSAAVSVNTAAIVSTNNVVSALEVRVSAASATGVSNSSAITSINAVTSSLDVRVSTLEVAISAIGDVSAIAALVSNVAILDAEVSLLTIRVDSVSAATSANTVAITSINAVTSTLEVRVSTLEAAVSAIGDVSAIAALVSTVGLLDAEVSALQIQVNAVSVSVSQRVLKAGDTMTGPLIVDVSSASTALRITQTGTGNSLLVEDSANPDATPFVVTGDGNVGIGTSSPAVKLDVNGSINGTWAGATIAVANGGTGATTLTGVVIGNGASAFTAKTNPAGAFVGTTDTQTLTNKTAERLILNDGYTEEVFAITDGATVNLDPNNGSIQTWTLGANRTPGQVNWSAGQSITLMIDDGTARTITWTTLGVVWETNGGTAPTLATSGFTVIVLWKVSTTIYGARVGDA
jgi:hypothetical protein